MLSELPDLQQGPEGLDEGDDSVNDPIAPISCVRQGGAALIE